MTLLNNDKIGQTFVFDYSIIIHLLPAYKDCYLVFSKFGNTVLKNTQHISLNTVGTEFFVAFTHCNLFLSECYIFYCHARTLLILTLQRYLRQLSTGQVSKGYVLKKEKRCSALKRKKNMTSSCDICNTN